MDEYSSYSYVTSDSDVTEYVSDEEALDYPNDPVFAD